MSKSKLTNNLVDHPRHYTEHPSGIEAIEFCGYMGFNIGNAFKYLYRLDKKWDSLEDLRKARWYINRELFQRKCNHFNKKSLISVTTANKWFFVDSNIKRILALESTLNTKNHSITKIIGNTPSNIEKALFYLWEANLITIGTSQLQAAKAFVNAEIHKRQRNFKKAK